MNSHGSVFISSESEFKDKNLASKSEKSTGVNVIWHYLCPWETPQWNWPAHASRNDLYSANVDQHNHVYSRLSYTSNIKSSLWAEADSGAFSAQCRYKHGSDIDSRVKTISQMFLFLLTCFFGEGKSVYTWYVDWCVLIQQ